MLRGGIVSVDGVGICVGRAVSFVPGTTGSAEAAVVHGAEISVLARREFGLHSGVVARAGGRIAGAYSAPVFILAVDGRAGVTRAGLTRIAGRAEIAVVAGRAVGLDRVGADAIGGIAGAGVVALIGWAGLQVSAAAPPLAGVGLGTGVAVATGGAVGFGGLEHMPVAASHVPAAWH